MYGIRTRLGGRGDLYTFDVMPGTFDLYCYMHCCSDALSDCDYYSIINEAPTVIC